MTIGAVSLDAAGAEGSVISRTQEGGGPMIGWLALEGGPWPESGDCAHAGMSNDAAHASVMIAKANAPARGPNIVAPIRPPPREATLRLRRVAVTCGCIMAREARPDGGRLLSPWKMK